YTSHFFFFSSRRRHTSFSRDWSSDVCSSDLGGATAEADQHGGPAQHDELGADRNLALLHVLFADVAIPAGDHDGLVVAADLQHRSEERSVGKEWRSQWERTQ